MRRSQGRRNHQFFLFLSPRVFLGLISQLPFCVPDLLSSLIKTISVSSLIVIHSSSLYCLLCVSNLLITPVYIISLLRSCCQDKAGCFPFHCKVTCDFLSFLSVAALFLPLFFLCFSSVSLQTILPTCGFPRFLWPHLSVPAQLYLSDRASSLSYLK